VARILPEVLDRATLDPADPRSALDGLEFALKGYLQAEETRLQAEVSYLKKVHSKLSGGAALELLSTNAALSRLDSVLAGLFPELEE
jgi:hypothetical protein